MTTEHQEACAACRIGGILRAPHLRVQLSPPGEPWTMLRFCDLICLQNWLEEEATADTPVVFRDEGWIDSHAHV